MTRALLLLRGLLALCALATLAGCVNMSGLSGNSSYACKAPEGVTCDSVSGTYANAIHDNLPSQRPRAGAAFEPAAPAPPPVRDDNALRVAASLPSPTQLRSSARILRLWFKPWEDADRDLYDQGYVYVQIDAGQWLIDHAQRQIRDAYAPLRPPPRNTSSASEPRNGAALPANLKSAGRPLPADNPFPGLVPSPVRPESSD
jgi:conjugal transfer pilus assembly protein TraV